MRPFELFLGLRYLRASRRSGFLSLITLISTLGITLGVAALITVMSVMNGFQDEVRNRLLGITSHITVSAYGGLGEAWRPILKEARRLNPVQAGAPFVRQQGMLSRAGTVSGVSIRGILPAWEPKVSELLEELERGELSQLAPGQYGLIIGTDLADKLGVGLGDRVTVVAPQGQITPAGRLPRFKQFTLVGLFDAGMRKYNLGLAYGHLADIQKLYRMGNTITGVRLSLQEPLQAPQVAKRLRERLGGPYFVSDWTQRNQNFFRALQTEKVAMFVILSLVVVVAAFNIVSSLIMLVNEKRNDIAILQTLGASSGHITAIFMLQGLLIGLIGILIGVGGGVVLALNVGALMEWLEGILQTQLLPADVYPVSHLPSKLEWHDVAWISGAALILSFLATIYPARKAAATDPVEVLRHE